MTKKTEMNKALIKVATTPNPMFDENILDTSSMVFDQIGVIGQWIAEVNDIHAELDQMWTALHHADTLSNAVAAVGDVRRVAVRLAHKMAAVAFD